MLAVGPPVDGTPVAGAVEAGTLVSGGGGAPVVTGALGGGAFVVCGGVTVGAGGALVVGSLVAAGGAEVGGGGEDGGAEDGGPLVGPGLVGRGLEGCGPEGPEPGPEDEGGGTEVDGEEGEEGEDAGGADGVDGVEVDGLRAGGEFPPATLNVTYSPNRSSVPAGGSDLVTRAPSGGSAPPAKATASPLSASSRLACPNVAPVRSGTARGSRASNAVSFSPAVPTGRLMPRSGSSTSTSASRSTFREAGRTATTDSFSYPFHSSLRSSKSTFIRVVSPSKGRSGFPHEHFTAGRPSASTRIAIPASSNALKGTAFSFL